MSTLFFDLDGTLVDSAPSILVSVRHMLTTMGVEPPPDDELRWVIGPPLRPTFTKLLGSDEHIEAGVKIYRDHYASFGLAACDPFAGIADELIHLHSAGHTLVVCTSKMESFANAIIERIGLANLFDAVHGAQSGVDEHKSELLARLVRERDVDANHATMIGDRREDIIAGKSNGLATLGVLWGYGGEGELTAAGATTICAAVADLRHVLGAPR